MEITIRYDGVSGEYHARQNGKIIGNAVFHKEAGDSGLWNYSVKGHGAWTSEDRETALLSLYRKCQQHYGEQSKEEIKAA